MSRPKVITRKLIRSKSDEEKFQILWKYSRGIDEDTIASEHSLDPKSLKEYLWEFSRSIITVYETKKIHKDSNKMTVNLVPTLDPKYINQEFLNLISASTDTLTDAEQTYCFLYVENGCNNEIALEGSGLTAGLPKTIPSYNNMLHLRGQYLRAKDNVKREIRELRAEVVTKELVSKDALQLELLDIIKNLKLSGKSPGQMLKAIELLMRSENQLQQNVNVKSVDPADEMRKLVDMVKKDEVYVKA